MGMSIDEAKSILIYQYKYGQMEEDVHKALGMAIALMDVYEVRLEADMLAMLTDLQLEIEELDTPSNGAAYMTCSEIIQQKINALKAKEGEK